MTSELDCNHLEYAPETLVQTIKWRPKIEGRTDNILMTACNDTMIEWHVPSRKKVNEIRIPETTIYSLEYSNDGLTYAMGLKDCSIKVFDGTTRKEIVQLGGVENAKVPGHQNKVYALKYHRDDPKVLISGGWDDNLLFWDLNS